MFEDAWPVVMDFVERGGPIMWPLLALSLIALTLIFERCWFWLHTNNARRRRKFARIARHLRMGERAEAAGLIRGDNSAYAHFVDQLLVEGASDATATDAIETQRSKLERFMPTLGTIITAAPMLGILGTVVGIIASFRVLGDAQAAMDPSKVGGGIAEALLTTVAGLVVALVVLFPYNAFRMQIDRTLGRMEALGAAAQHAHPNKADSANDDPGAS